MFINVSKSHGCSATARTSTSTGSSASTTTGNSSWFSIASIRSKATPVVSRMRLVSSTAARARESRTRSLLIEGLRTSIGKCRKWRSTTAMRVEGVRTVMSVARWAGDLLRERLLEHVHVGIDETRA